MELLELLNTVPDPHAQRGKRHPLSLVLLVILMGTMLSYSVYRPLKVPSPSMTRPRKTS